MKIDQIVNEPKSQPKVYVDMDGVLVNLFGHAANLHDVETYRHIKPEEWDKFFKEANAYELFSNLDPFPNANNILSTVRELFDGYTILSSPLNFDREGSIQGKKHWLKKHINIPADQWIFDEEKYKYATQSDGTPNILIDDYGVNIKKWRDAGGIGIKFQNDEDHTRKLFEILSRLKDIFQKHLNQPVNEIQTIKFPKQFGLNTIKDRYNRYTRQYNYDKIGQLGKFIIIGPKNADDSDDQEIFLLDSENKFRPIAQMTLEKDSDFPKFFVTSYSIIASQYQGQNLAARTYAFLARRGYNLISDQHQSPGGQSIWAKLAKLPGIFVYAIHTDGKKIKYDQVDFDDKRLSGASTSVYDDELENEIEELYYRYEQLKKEIAKTKDFKKSTALHREQKSILKQIDLLNDQQETTGSSSRLAVIGSKINESAGVGRITKQNQTADVGPNEVSKQAAKFGNSVDRDGRPPLLNTKATKNTSVNKLNNLGIK